MEISVIHICTLLPWPVRTSTATCLSTDSGEGSGQQRGGGRAADPLRVRVDTAKYILRPALFAKCIAYTTVCAATPAPDGGGQHLKASGAHANAHEPYGTQTRPARPIECQGDAPIIRAVLGTKKTRRPPVPSDLRRASADE